MRRYAVIYYGFNSRSREGSDEMIALLYRRVSNVSIHAPARGATTMRGNVARQIIGFNSRSREGSDVILVRAIPLLEVVSIHAPARGAT